MSTTKRDISWGADCETCGTRMDAGRAERALATMTDDRLLCGSCIDEEKAAAVRDALRELYAAGQAMVPHMPAIKASVVIRWDEAMQAAHDLLEGGA
jgi:hypothetical protein